MKKYILFFIFVVSIFAQSCTKKKTDMRISSFDTPVITGYYGRNHSGDFTGAVGVPNIQTSSSNNEYSFSSFPNPCSDCINFFIYSSPNIKKKLWLTKAQASGNALISAFDFYAITMNAGGAPLFEAEFNSNRIAINISSLSNGYYRVYLQINNQIMFDNIIINN